MQPDKIRKLVFVALVSLVACLLQGICRDTLPSSRQVYPPTATAVHPATLTPTIPVRSVQYEPAAYTCPSGCEIPYPNCLIKGNISIATGEKIYHVPGQKWYNDTRISPEYGEAWFCTEAEARANGFRRSYE